MGRRKKVTDEEMIRGARECFLKHGPQVSTAVIADCVGVSQAAVFKRFPTKEELMVAALAPPVHPEWIHILEEGPDDRPIREQLTEVAGFLNAHIEKVFPRIHMLHASGLHPHRAFKELKYPPIVTMSQTLASWFRRAQKRGMIRKSNPNSLALMLMGAIHSRTFIQHMTEGKLMKISGRAHIKNLVDQLWKGIAPEGGKE